MKSQPGFNRMGREAALGLDGFIAAVSQLAGQFPSTRMGTAHFVLRASADFACIRLQDLYRPWRFLRQMAGPPPVQFGITGFNPMLVDDKNPARHYMAFVFLGFWLPTILAVMGLWLWEIAGLVRYGYWATKDVRMGYVGIRHGRLLWRYGAVILPGLMAADLAES